MRSIFIIALVSSAAATTPKEKTCSPDNFPWTEMIEDTWSLNMLQMRGHQASPPKTTDIGKNSVPLAEHDDATLAQADASSGTHLAEFTFTVVGVNHTSGCTATFKIQASNLVVKDANAKQHGYHFGDLASDQDISVSGKVKSLNVTGCCEVTIFTKLNYQGESKTYKQGTHTDVMGTINSVRLKPRACAPTPAPGPLPLTGLFAEFPKCQDDKGIPFNKNMGVKIDFMEKHYAEKVMQDMMKDTRKCTVGKLTTGAIRTEGKHKRFFHPAFCSSKNTYSWKPGQFTKDFCIKACLEMKGIAIQISYNTIAQKKEATSPGSCACFFAGDLQRPVDPERGPPCPCGWETMHGYPKKGGYKWEDSAPVKRGEAEPMTKFQTAQSWSASIACDGADPPSYQADWYLPAL